MPAFQIDNDRLARYRREADAAAGIYAAAQERAAEARRELRAAQDELERLDQSGPGYHSHDYLAALARSGHQGMLNDLAERHERRVEGARKRLDAARQAHREAQADLAEAADASRHARALFEQLAKHAEQHRSAGGESIGLVPRLRKMLAHTDPGGRI